MIDINWKQDYKGEFSCPQCNSTELALGGFFKEKRQFYCHQCNRRTLASVNLNRRNRYLDSRLRDEYTNWEKDYHGDFLCPKCGVRGMSVQGITQLTKKRRFQCLSCNNVQQESYRISIKAIKDPHIQELTWYTNHRIQGFVCPHCQAEDIYLDSIKYRNKKLFKCRSCGRHQYDSIILNAGNLSHHQINSPLVKLFNWIDDIWDLRAINPNFDDKDKRYYLISFFDFNLDWFKHKIKDFIQYLCKTESSLSTISTSLKCLKFFSRYLVKENISGFDKINRSIILDYLAHEKKGNTGKLLVLRKFFTVGTTKGWFNIDQDIIRDADYPKQYQGNPNPISNIVREKIEQNLHLLPDPITRMWSIGYFCAMRPSELALLKRDCLVQEGQHWKMVWHRKKTKDLHEIPISRTIAEVVQQQQEYIQNLWGEEWEYLFCHYHNLSRTKPSQPKLKPIKKVLGSHGIEPLLIGIRSLILALDIRDENGQPAEFYPKLLRSTRLTELFAQGHDLSIVSAWAGHKHFATTSTYYTEVSCELMEREAGHIQKALVNSNGHHISYESYPKSFWENPTAHKLELGETHINTPIIGYCGLPLDQMCHKFRSCYTCSMFVATLEKLPQYIHVRDLLRAKQATALSAGHEVLFEQFGKQADQLDKIIASLQQEAA
jgi:integrase/transcription elongation factor Elf1